MGRKERCEFGVKMGERRGGSPVSVGGGVFLLEYFWWFPWQTAVSGEIYKVRGCPGVLGAGSPVRVADRCESGLLWKTITFRPLKSQFVRSV